MILLIIDVRELDELEGGIIEDSIHMPLGLCIRNVKKKQIEDMKDKKICTYCGTGYRGNIAADELNQRRIQCSNPRRGLFSMDVEDSID